MRIEFTEFKGNLYMFIRYKDKSYYVKLTPVGKGKVYSLREMQEGKK